MNYAIPKIFKQERWIFLNCLKKGKFTKVGRLQNNINRGRNHMMGAVKTSFQKHKQELIEQYKNKK